MKRIAENRGATYEVAQLSSLFTVCAAALNVVDEYSDDIARGIRQDVQHVLEWGAVLAGNICEDVEKLEAGKAVSK